MYTRCIPGGTVSFILDVCGKDMSDVEVVRNSCFLDKLERNNKIMADKGFSNKDDFLLVRAELITPVILRKDNQFPISINFVNAEISNSTNLCGESYWENERP